MSILSNVIDFGDDVGAKIIMKASEKQKRINVLLENEQSDVRIDSFKIQMGTPPSIIFSIKPISEK